MWWTCEKHYKYSFGKYSPEEILLVDDNAKEKEIILGCRTSVNWNNQKIYHLL